MAQNDNYNPNRNCGCGCGNGCNGCKHEHKDKCEEKCINECDYAQEKMVYFNYIQKVDQTVVAGIALNSVWTSNVPLSTTINICTGLSSEIQGLYPIGFLGSETEVLQDAAVDSASAAALDPSASNQAVAQAAILDLANYLTYLNKCNTNSDKANINAAIVALQAAAAAYGAGSTDDLSSALTALSDAFTNSGLDSNLVIEIVALIGASKTTLGTNTALIPSTVLFIVEVALLLATSIISPLMKKVYLYQLNPHKITSWTGFFAEVEAFKKAHPDADLKPLLPKAPEVKPIETYGYKDLTLIAEYVITRINELSLPECIKITLVDKIVNAYEELQVNDASNVFHGFCGGLRIPECGPIFIESDPDLIKFLLQIKFLLRSYFTNSCNCDLTFEEVCHYVFGRFCVVEA